MTWSESRVSGVTGDSIYRLGTVKIIITGKVVCAILAIHHRFVAAASPWSFRQFHIQCQDDQQLTFTQYSIIATRIILRSV